MNLVFQEIKISLLATIITALILCGLYPAVIWGIASMVYPQQANGSLIYDQSEVKRGSLLLGQPFSSIQYFHPRPSAAGLGGYDGASSGGSNLGPTSKVFIESVSQRVNDYRKINRVPSSVRIPMDAVTASGSGLDPHISPQNARLQASRVAEARGIALEHIMKLIEKYTGMSQTLLKLQ